MLTEDTVSPFCKELSNKRQVGEENIQVHSLKSYNLEWQESMATVDLW